MQREFSEKKLLQRAITNVTHRKIDLIRMVWNATKLIAELQVFCFRVARHQNMASSFSVLQLCAL
jgi:hypothetical protein